MRILKQAWPVMMLAVWMVGCTSTRITNLTPDQQMRSPGGLYPVEAALDSTQETLKWDTIQPSVVVGADFYPMRQTPLMKNRWETLVPVPPNVSVVYYRIKFDYDYNTFNHPKADSKFSRQYRLEIIDREGQHAPEVMQQYFISPLKH